MPPHYSYRVDHDLGFAPHIARGLCTVCGCKATTIERWAKVGSWVVGIGGEGTGKPDSLIYAMKVEATPSYRQFKKANPRGASYLSGQGIPLDAPVLVSRQFFYFGHNAPPLPQQLSKIIHPTQGCKGLSDHDIALLEQLVLNKFSPGVRGKPNNGLPSQCNSC